MAEKKAISLTDLLENKELTGDAVRGILSAFCTPESLHIVIDALGKQIDSEKMNEAEAVWHLFWFQQLAYNDFIRTVGFFIEDGGLDVDEFRALLREEYGPVQTMCCDFFDKHGARIKDTLTIKGLKKLVEESIKNIQKAADPLTDGECIQKLDDTGYITINQRVKNKTAYVVKKGHSVLDVFDELAKITGSERRARAIMLQNMSRVETSLSKHRPKRTLKN